MEINLSILNWLPLFIVLLPLFAGLILYVKGAEKPALISSLVLGSTGLSLLITVSFYSSVAAGLFPAIKLNILPPVGLSFQVDYLGFYTLLIFVTAGLVVSIYALRFMDISDEKRHRYFCFHMLVLSGCYGVALAADFFSFYLFFEFMSIMFFVLVAHNQGREAVRAAFKFLIMTIIAGVSLFLAVAIIYWETGTLEFASAGLGLNNSPLLLVSFIGFVIAFGIKAAMFPLHLWMPDAYSEGPLPAAALSSMIMLKTGVYGLIRVFGNIYGIEYLSKVDWGSYLVILAGFTILFGSIVALAQKDLIRRLAYSGVAQLGYIVLGIAMLNELALIGAAYHMLAHTFMKGTLFLCAGIMVKEAGSRKIVDMKAIGARIPVTMICFTIASLTAVGMPPFNIFVSKWHLGLGALEINNLVLILILLASSMLNAAYYLPIVTRAFMGAEKAEDSGTGKSSDHENVNSKGNKEPCLSGKGSLSLLTEAPLALLIPTIILALGCFLFNMFPSNIPLELIEKGVSLYF